MNREPTPSELLKAWMTARDAANAFAGQYVVVEAVQPDKDIKAGKALTPEASAEIERLRTVEREAQELYNSKW